MNAKLLSLALLVLAAIDLHAQDAAPAATHRVSVSICSAVRLNSDSGGGIRSSGSVEIIRRTSSLAAASPGTTAPSANAPSAVSSRSPALRVFASGPWHA